ncbi:MAG: hypothetical protein WKF37_11935 [Bryobacteraceae bacterium]
MKIRTQLFLTSLLLGGSVSHGQGVAPFRSVSAATYSAGSLAPESIVAGFGSNFATTTSVAPAGDLPTTLDGVNIQIVDSSLASTAAPLYFVSPSQINYLIPPSVRSGPATISARRGQTVLASDTVQIDSVSPGLFGVAQNGLGLAAARAILISGSDATTSQLIAEYCARQMRSHPDRHR